MKYFVYTLPITIFIIAYLQFGPAVFASNASNSSLTGSVVSVVDGDTVRFVAGDRDYLIELTGIDAPELGQRFGKHAHDYLSDLVRHRSVTVIMGKPDRDGLLHGEIILDGVSINKLLLEDGFVWARRGTVKDKVWIGMEQLARDRGFGLWRDDNVIAPWEYRELVRAGVGEET